MISLQRICDKLFTDSHFSTDFCGSSVLGMAWGLTTSSELVISHDSSQNSEKWGSHNYSVIVKDVTDLVKFSLLHTDQGTWERTWGIHALFRELLSRAWGVH